MAGISHVNGIARSKTLLQQPVRGALSTSSPGIVLAVLGSILMCLTIAIPFRVETDDSNLYLSDVGERSQTSLPPPRHFPERVESDGSQDDDALQNEEDRLFGRQRQGVYMCRLRIKLLLTAAGASLALAQPVASDPFYERGASAWQAGDYSQAVELLLEYRKTDYGRRPGVDFVLGTSGCRLPQLLDWGRDVLGWMLYAYSLSPDSRVTVEYERRLCAVAAAQATTIKSMARKIAEARSAGMSGHGKTFYWPDKKIQPVLSYPVRRIREMDLPEFRGRLVPLDEPDRAREMAAALVPEGKNHVAEHVLIISQVGHTDGELRSIAATFNRFLAYLQSSLNISPPPYFITVHLPGDSAAVKKTALDLHGLDVSEATFGYAFVDDLSVVGNTVGTIKHELFHLAARQHFGGIPQWLDEGIASLYEGSERNLDAYVGVDNWRGQVLEGLWEQRPTIRKLISSEWFPFDDPQQAASIERIGEEANLDQFGATSEEQADMMATARYFAMYLQQNGLLEEVYAAFRDKGFAKIEGDATEHAVGLIEESLGKQTYDIDDDFAKWFQSGGPE